MTKKSEKSEKRSDIELEDAYYARVEHCVQQVDKWLGKLAKVSHSKKYELGDGKREFIVEHLNSESAETIEKIRGTARPTVKQFKLT